MAYYNRFQACRFGLEGTVVHPKTFEYSTLREEIHRTLDVVRGRMTPGDIPVLMHIDGLLRTGSDASYLREQHGERGSSEGMVDAAIACLRGNDGA